MPVVERVHEIHYAGDEKRGWDEGMWKVMAAMEEAAAKGDESFADFVARSEFDEAAKRAATSYVEGFNAARSEVIGIQSLAQDSKAAEAIEGDRSFHLLKGYDAVALELLPSNCELHLNTAVERIVWKRGAVTAHVRSSVDGSSGTVAARRVIVTVSLGCLQAAIRADAGVSEAGISGVGRGGVSDVVVGAAGAGAGDYGVERGAESGCAAGEIQD
jgi:hypothetical protein